MTAIDRNSYRRSYFRGASSRATTAQISTKTPSVRKRCTHPGAGAKANVHTAQPTSIAIAAGNAACLSIGDDLSVVFVESSVSGMGLIDGSWRCP